MRFPITLCAAGLALFSATGAEARTIFATGDYAAGEQAFGGGDVALGPGSYRVSFETSAHFAEFYGQVQKISYWAEWCDARDGSGEFFCAGNSIPTIPLSEPVTPTLYQLKITVKPFVETLTPDDFIVRRIDFDECCTYAFDFVAGEAGSYSISYAAIPEPATWALLILGFGAVGAAQRRKPAVRAATS